MPLDYAHAFEQNDETTPLAIVKDAVLIDTSSIYGLPNFTDVSSQLAMVSGRPHGDGGAINAVDGDPNSYWQVCGNQPFPIQLELIFPTAHTLKAYSLSTVEEPDRMPTNWEIWVSSDHVNWRQRQKMTDAKPWQDAEERRYNIEPAPETSAVKLLITATSAKSCMRLYEFRPKFE